MLISTHFNRFFHGVVIKQLKEQSKYPLRYQHPYSGEWFLLDLSKISDDGVYQFLKLINPDYPKLNGILPASTKVLSTKMMSDHIKWIELLAMENGIELKYISDEWDRLLEENNIKKD